MIIPLKAFDSNYIWTIAHKQRCVVVDPGDATIVNSFLAEQKWTLEAILLTHHHADHSGGIADLLQQHPTCIVVTSADSQVPLPNHQRRLVSDLHSFSLLEDTLTFTVLETPGHTLDHIVFFSEHNLSGTPLLFCGDTLFSAGCGRIFEGTPAQMLTSLERIQQLPDHTHIYCAHEYTLQNLRWAREVEPTNKAIESYYQTLSQKEPPVMTIPSTLAKEKQINPFLRVLHLHPMLQKSGVITTEENTVLATFTALRAWKNNF